LVQRRVGARALRRLRYLLHSKIELTKRSAAVSGKNLLGGAPSRRSSIGCASLFCSLLEFDKRIKSDVVDLQAHFMSHTLQICTKHYQGLAGGAVFSSRHTRNMRRQSRAASMSPLGNSTRCCPPSSASNTSTRS